MSMYIHQFVCRYVSITPQYFITLLQSSSSLDTFLIALECPCSSQSSRQVYMCHIQGLYLFTNGMSLCHDPVCSVGWLCWNFFLADLMMPCLERGTFTW